MHTTQPTQGNAGFATLSTRSQFSDAFRDVGRATSFTHEGFTSLFEYLVSVRGYGSRVDPVELDGEYAEYTLEDFCGDYGYDNFTDEDAYSGDLDGLDFSDVKRETRDYRIVATFDGGESAIVCAF